MIAAIPIAAVAFGLRVVTRPGAAALAIAVYMLAIGVVFTGEGVWTCVDWEDSIAEIRRPGGGTEWYSTRTCARHGAGAVYLGLGVGMIATSAATFGGLVCSRSAIARRSQWTAAAVLSISGLYAYTPSGLVAGTFSIVFLVLGAMRNWELRPPRSKAKRVPHNA